MSDRPKQRLSRWLRSAGKLAQRPREAREAATAEKAAQEGAAFVEKSSVAACDRAAEFGQNIRVRHGDGVGNLLSASGRSRRRTERSEDCRDRCRGKFL